MRIGIALVLVACSSSHKAPSDAALPPAPASPASAAHTPNQFLGLGTPTFVIGTADPLTERAMRAQVGLIQPKFPGSQIVTDVKHGWPAHPVVYGAAHVNAALAGLQLPFVLVPGHLEIAGQRFDGDDIRLITVVPAASDHPEMLLYAGTGTPGIAEINAISHSNVPLTIADRFGVLVTGTWLPDGTAHLDPPHARPTWNDLNRTANGTPVNVHFLAAADPAAADAVAAGVVQSQQALGLDAQPAIDVYVYPDLDSKKQLTGNADGGTAVVEARTFHTIIVPPAAMTPHVAHEATHLLAYRTWGPAGTPLLGEGLAVWASGQYGGQTLAQWKPSLAKQHPTIAQALANGRAMPEPTLYPLGGILVELLVKTYGAAAVRDHFLGATAETWDDACKAVGTTPDALEASLDAALHAP